MLTLITLIYVNNMIGFNCENYNFIPIKKSSLIYNSEFCPTENNINRLKNCISANENEFCYTEGECNLNKNLNNCGYDNNKQYSIYVKQVKNRKLLEWHTIITKNRYYLSDDKQIFGCLDENDLLSENGYINYNPIIGYNDHLPKKTLKECENYCLNSKDSLGRKCIAYGTATTVDTVQTGSCKRFYKCDTYRKYDYTKFKNQMGVSTSSNYYFISYTIRKAIFHELETTTTKPRITSTKTTTDTTKTRTTKTKTTKTKTSITKTTTSKTITPTTITPTTITTTTITTTTITPTTITSGIIISTLTTSTTSTTTELYNTNLMIKYNKFNTLIFSLIICLLVIIIAFLYIKLIRNNNNNNNQTILHVNNESLNNNTERIFNNSLYYNNNEYYDDLNGNNENTTI